MKSYIIINSDKSTQQIRSFIITQPHIVVNKGDEKKYSSNTYSYNSCEFNFPSDDGTIENSLYYIKLFIKENAVSIEKMRILDCDLDISLKLVVELDENTLPDTYFDNEIVDLLSIIKSDIDIDLYHK